MLSCFPRDVLDEIWDLIESVSEAFPTYSCISRGIRTDLNTEHAHLKVKQKALSEKSFHYLMFGVASKVYGYIFRGNNFAIS